MACRLYVLAVLVETTVNLAIEGDLYLRIREAHQSEDDLATRRMPVYLGVFVLAQCVAYYYYYLLESHGRSLFQRVPVRHGS